MDRRFKVRCILGGVALAAVSTLTACGGSVPGLGAAAPSNPGKDGGSSLIRGALKSPASYIEYSNKVIWSGTNSSGDDAYIAQVDYEATNGFGGSVRDCKVVAFHTKKADPESYLYFPKRYMETCPEYSMFDEEFIVKIMKEGNFGL